MMASASVGGGVMFVPDHIERAIPKMAKRLSNDNEGDQAEQNA